MRVVFTIILMLTTFCSFGQECYPTDRKDIRSLLLGECNYIYKPANEKYFLNYANSLVGLKNPDSAFKASKILFGLSYYDAEKYSFDSLSGYLNVIVRNNIEFYKKSILGNWEFDTYFNPMGAGFYKGETKNKRVFFDNDTARFYQNDSLVHISVYCIVARYMIWPVQKGNFFNIYFSDLNEVWDIRLGNYFFYGNQLLPSKLTFSVLGCGCGCTHIIYKRVNAVALSVPAGFSPQ